MQFFLLALAVFLASPMSQVTAVLSEMTRGSIDLHSYSDGSSFWVGIETTSKADNAVVQIEYWEKSAKGLRLTNKVLQVTLGSVGSRTIPKSEQVPTSADFVKTVKITLLRATKKVESQTFPYRQAPPDTSNLV